jgi:hypothetical protein
VPDAIRDTDVPALTEKAGDDAVSINAIMPLLRKVNLAYSILRQ